MPERPPPARATVARNLEQYHHTLRVPEPLCRPGCQCGHMCCEILILSARELGEAVFPQAWSVRELLARAPSSTVRYRLLSVEAYVQRDLRHAFRIYCPPYVHQLSFEPQKTVDAHRYLSAVAISLEREWRYK